ncbi:MAG: c-type cytochrome [Sulfuricurvum sp.]|uniref:cytochrome-c peroxidase n=1 Tax=Sulfuricurvum sp. TaxID=2025608 RepID=UPI0025F0028C|nr:cytochrome c peroxidase [Sulfuricurvum sp.]MCK9373320.1 c-type cytochrome [Sulfuricurvum sp.]
MFKKSVYSFVTAMVVAGVGSSVFAAAEASHFTRPANVPFPADNAMAKERIELGKLLFFDVRLSKSEQISCATCHDPKKGWSDGLPKAVGHEGRMGPRNTPTILNGAYQQTQFWDGRAATLEEQALGPIQADVEMNMPLDELIVKLNGIPGYVKLFAKAYPGEGVTKESLAKAIASFERTVVSSNAPFDRFIKGDKKAISENAKKGFELFKGKGGCTNCHDGFNFTDGSFHNIGLDDGDVGRYKVKSKEIFYGATKTPTLRDVTKSSPYFHNGSAETLEEASTVCSSGGKNPQARNVSTALKKADLTREEIGYLADFMKTLESPAMKLDIPTKFPK